VNAQPVANFSANRVSSCFPMVVQFSDLSTGSPTSWSWDLGNGIVTSVQNPSTIYSTPGLYTVKLTVTNASGTDTKTIAGYIQISQPPTVNFRVDDSSSTCGSKTVQLTNLSNPNSSGAAVYFWDFGDGTSSTAQNPPAHTYSAAGAYSMSLTVTNSNGCVQSLSKPNYITVLAKPVTGFTVANANSCGAPFTANFSSTSVGAVSYAWDFGDGGTSTASSPTHTYVNPGSYFGRLITTSASGCKDTLTKKGFINVGTITASFTTSPATICTGNPVTFTNTTTPGGAGSTWYFGDGNSSTQVNPTHAYSSPGTYSVKLVVAYSTCSDSITHNLTVTAGAMASFTASPLAGCSPPDTVTFTNTTSGASSFLWLFGDGNTSATTSPTHIYSSVDSFDVSLVAISANGCTDTLTRKDYIVIDTPTATLSNNPFLGCVSALSNLSVNVVSPVPVSSYAWSFGDGNSSTTTVPTASHSYASSAGNPYTVTVNMTTANGCSFSATQNVFVGTHLSPSFTATPTTVCKGTPVVFTNTTSGTATGYTWFFGDKQSSTLSNPTHVYDTPNVFTVMLVTSNYGCPDTSVSTNFITVQPPKAIFTDSFLCSNRLKYWFNNKSLGGSSYSWDFGDGTTSTIANPSHTYLGYGVYQVKLTVSNSATGCIDSFIEAINVYQLDPSFSTPYTNVCKGQMVQMTPVNLNYPYYRWDFGIGFYSYANIPYPTFTNSGIFTIKLLVADDRGCMDSMTKTNYIVVHAPVPNFSASTTSACAYTPVNFSDLSVATTGMSITSNFWDFGDGDTLTTTGGSITHRYKTAGTFTVKMRATETGGCSEEIQKTSFITIRKPAAAFNSPDTNACLGKSAQFFNSSSGGAPISYSWDFGDLSTSSTANPTHTYAANGKYTVRLIATDASGCQDTSNQAQYIDVSSVTAKFGVSDTSLPCAPATVSFFDSSVSASSYLWSFGNGGTSSIVNPTAIYFTSGTFTARLIAINSKGCRDTAQRSIVIGPGPTGTFSYSPKAGCSPLTVTFVSSTSNSDSMMFDFGNGVVIKAAGTTTSLNYNYVQPGRYRPTLILTDTLGCMSFIQGVDTVKVTKAYAGFSYSATNGKSCVGVPIQFNDTSSATLSTISSRSWNFGDGGTSTSNSPLHTYATAGTYQVKLFVTTANGCIDSVIKSIIINPLPVVIAANQTICGLSSVMLNASGAASYAWKPSTGLSCNNCASPIASPASTTTYTIVGTSSFGCIDSGTVTVTVSPAPTVSAGPDVNICFGASTALTATGAATYSWSPSTGLSATTGASVTATPASTTTYFVTGTTAAGCSDTDTVVIVVNPIPVVSVTPSQAICIGGSATLTATGATTYSWSPSTGLSSTTGATVTANPATTTTYTVVGTSNGCSAQASTTITVNPLPVIQITGSNVLCAGQSTTLTASGASTYSWSPSTGLSATTGVVVTVQPATTTTYTVSGTATTGCVNTANISVTVYPVPTVFAGKDTSLCAGGLVPLSASGATTYSWSPATGLSSTTVSNPTAQPTTTTTYVVIGLDAHSCSDTDTVIVTVHPLPVVNAGSNKSVCPGGSATLNGTGASAYSWAPAATLSCNNCASPVAMPATTTTYVLTGTSALGCINTSQVTVTVISKPTISIAGNRAFCIGSGTTLTASGANTFIWSPATGLSATTGATVTAQPSSATTYTVIGTSGAGCSDTTTVTITINALPIVNAGPDTSICAGGNVQLNASGASTYSWSNSGSLSSGSVANPYAGPATTTNYVVTGTDANGCSNKDSVIVTVHPKPVVSAGSNTSICPGGTATLAATGASSYSWTPAATLSCNNCANPIATPATTTTYTVTGTDNFGCVNTSSVTVQVGSAPVVTINGINTICAGSSTILAAAGANSFSWSPATGLNTTTSATVIAQPAATTTYTVTGTSGVGCSGTATITIRVNALPLVNAGVDTSLCKGNSVVLTASGASSYTWSPSTGLSATNIASPTASPAATTTYFVTGTDANGCSKKDSLLVTVNVLPNVTASANTSVCPGGTVTLSANGAATFSWTPSATLSCNNCANPVASPSSTTTYVVTGTSSQGCIDTGMVTVAVNPTPVVTLSGPLNICFGDTTTLTVSGASTFTWIPSTNLSATTGVTVKAYPTTTTSYKVVGTNGIGCSDTLMFTINVNPLPIVTAGSDTTICFGSSVPLAATGASAYLWSPATGLSSTVVANPTASPATSTSYVVKGTDSKGCSNQDTVLVTVNPLPVVSAGSNTSICLGNSTTLNGSGAVSYSWSPSASLSCNTCTSPIATPATTTTYVLTGTSASGCIDTAHVTVFVSPLPQIVVAGNRSICFGSSTTLSATGATGFTWSPATGLSCTSCANPIASPTTTTTYTLTGSSGAGCNNQITVQIVVNPLPVLSVIDTQRTCLNTPASLSVSGATSYVWSPSSSLSCSSCASPQATPTATTTYTVIGTDVNGCMDTAQSTVIIKPLPAVSAGPDISGCKMSTAVLHATGAKTYIWSPATGLSCTACSSPTATPTITTNYVVEGTDSNGCIGRDTMSFIIYDQPLVNAGPDQTICGGQSTNLVASGASSYEWEPGSSLSCVSCPNPTATPAVTTTYKVHGTDANGCIDSDQVTIRVIEHEPVSVDSGAAYCLGGSIRLNATGGTLYTWLPADGLSCVNCPNPVASPQTTTTYSVIIRQGSCFTDTLKSTVVVYQPPVINAGPDQAIVLGESVKLQTTGSDITHYSWTPSTGLSCDDCEAPMAAPPVTTTYAVTAISEHGCTASDDVTVSVRCDGSQIWLPNTFTPNADGQNDFFYPHGKGLSAINRFRIYDRWGELIFDRANMSVNDRNSGWDGTYKNQTLKPDVYVWIINATCTNGDALELKGDISLIR
jgi:gliding motility-associated-like protein